MQKHTRKKRQTKKHVPAPKLFFHTQWGWMLALLVMITGCFVLIAFATGRQQAAQDNVTIPSKVPPVTGTYAPTLTGSGNTEHVQQTTGIFSLSEGGPIPVPANVLHPTNIARLVVNNLITSIYAGAMTRTPAIGAIAILQENITTGQQSLDLYQTMQTVGEVTILAIHNGILTLSSPTTHGTFNLTTHQFYFL